MESFTWSPDSNALFFTVEDRGRQSIEMIPASGGATRVIVSGASTLDDMQFTADGKTMIYTGAKRIGAHRDLSRRFSRRRARRAHASERRAAGAIRRSRRWRISGWIAPTRRASRASW